MKDVFNVREILLFKIIMQKMILYRTREDGVSCHDQYKNNNFTNN